MLTSVLSDDALTTTKTQIHAGLHALAQGAPAAKIYGPDPVWFGSHPFNEVTGAVAIDEIWTALRTAFTGLERRDQIFVAGANAPDPRVDTARPPALVATMGSYTGIFEAPFLGLKPTGNPVTLPSAEVHAFTQDGKISQSWVLFDLLEFLRQIGRYPLAPMLGAEGIWLGPATGDGVRLDRSDAALGAESLGRVLEMHAALGTFDGKDLDSMDHAAYWTPDFVWAGAAGIGTTRGMTGFRAHHQIPFLQGFPDRYGAGHYIRIGDGRYAVTGGWPSVRGTHLGPWLGMPATGKPVDRRVMDFYRLTQDNRIAENWVPMDIPHIALQMGVDLFKRARHLDGDAQITL